jgi:hypothetical protein
MNPDYVLIFLFFLLILLFYLAIKYFKILFFYLWVLLWIILWVYGHIFIETNDYNLAFLKKFFGNINNFFKESYIIQFLWNHIGLFLFLIIIALFHKFFYYLLLIFLYFIKWFVTSIIEWITNKKEKIIIKENNKTLDNQE